MKQLMILGLMMVMTVSANAFIYKDARKEALFLSDNLTSGIANLFLIS